MIRDKYHRIRIATWAQPHESSQAILRPNSCPSLLKVITTVQNAGVSRCAAASGVRSSTTVASGLVDGPLGSRSTSVARTRSVSHIEYSSSPLPISRKSKAEKSRHVTAASVAPLPKPRDADFSKASPSGRTSHTAIDVKQLNKAGGRVPTDDNKFHVLRGLSRELASIPCEDFAQRVQFIREHLDVLLVEPSPFFKEALAQIRNSRPIAAKRCLTSLSILHLCRRTETGAIESVFRDIQDPRTRVRKSILSILEVLTKEMMLQAAQPRSDDPLRSSLQMRLSKDNNMPSSLGSGASSTWHVEKLISKADACLDLKSEIDSIQSGRIFILEGRKYRKIDHHRVQLLSSNPTSDDVVSSYTCPSTSRFSHSVKSWHAELHASNDDSAHQSKSNVSDGTETKPETSFDSSESSNEEHVRDCIETPPSYSSLKYEDVLDLSGGSNVLGEKKVMFSHDLGRAKTSHYSLESPLFVKDNHRLQAGLGLPYTDTICFVNQFNRLSMRAGPEAMPESRSVNSISGANLFTGTIFDAPTQESATGMPRGGIQITPTNSKRRKTEYDQHKLMTNKRMSLAARNEPLSPSGSGSGSGSGYSTAGEPDTFACPYWKHDPQLFSRCATNVLKDISILKQHLNRHHKRPEFHCLRCFQKFDSRENLETHMQHEISCERKPDPYVGKMTCHVEKEINTKERGRPPVEKWYHLYETLFPGAKRPDSPYKGDIAVVECIQQFVNLFELIDAGTTRAMLRDLRGKTVKHTSPSENKTLDIIHRSLREFSARMRDKQGTSTEQMTQECSQGCHASIHGDLPLHDCNAQKSLEQLIDEIEMLYQQQDPQPLQEHFYEHHPSDLMNCSQEAISNNFASDSPFDLSSSTSNPHSEIDHSFSLLDHNSADFVYAQNNPEVDPFYYQSLPASHLHL